MAGKKYDKNSNWVRAIRAIVGNALLRVIYYHNITHDHQVILPPKMVPAVLT